MLNFKIKQDLHVKRHLSSLLFDLQFGIPKDILATSSVRSRVRFREFVHTLGRVVAKPTHQRVCAVATRRNTRMEEIRLLSEATTYIFPHRNG